MNFQLSTAFLLIFLASGICEQFLPGELSGYSQIRHAKKSCISLE